MPSHVETKVGEVETYAPRQSGSEGGRIAAFAPQCHRQEVIMQYVDGSNKPYLKFTGVKKWCFDGYRVLSGGMDVVTWIRSDQQYGPGKNGYVYVPSRLQSTDRYLAYNGHVNGAHQSTRIGRFEYRVHGLSQPAQVLMPYVSRTGLYGGACEGPNPKDVAPKVTSVKPANGATGVPATANVTATFSYPMNASTLSGYTFDLIERGTGRLVGASYRYDAATKTATLDPASRLTAGATYTATVYGGPYGAKTAAGDPLIDGKTWSFAVAR